MEISNQTQASPGNSFTCFLIGQDRLLLECASLIRQRQGTIVGIISPSPQVKAWAQSQTIAWFGSLADVDWPVQSADYLFSIVNNEIIPQTVLSKIRHLAINYHDAPLPRYAGSNATAWAILNGEANHAVSWHCISAEIDAGDLLKQRAFELQADETTLSLNLKCIEHAMTSFAELLEELVTGRWQRSPQNLAVRSYFSRAQKPPDNGWINWHTEAAQLARLSRATRFGKYRNPLTVPKLLINDAVLVPGALTVLPERSHQPPGTLLDIRPQGWIVATLTHNVKISALGAPREKWPEDLTLVASQYQLVKGQCLPSPKTDQGELLKQFSERLLRHEAYWIAKLEQFEPTPVGTSLTRIDLTRAPLAVLERLKQTGSDAQQASLVLLTAWLIYLRRSQAQTRLTVTVAWEHTDLPESIAPFFARHLPVTVTIDDQQNFHETCSQVRQECEQMRQHGTYLIDCWLRYPELTERRTQATGCQIRIGIIAAQDDGDSSLPKPFLTLLDSLLAQPQQPIEQAQWITATERHQLLVEWNQTETPYPEHQTIHGLFEEQVQKTPGNLAVIAAGVQLSYQELNQHANRLAHYLLAFYGIVPDQLVAVCLERSQWLPVALLGILKSGAGYVPIDPGYPDNRIRFILEQTGARTIISTSHFVQRLLNLWEVDQQETPVVLLDLLALQPLWQQQSQDNPVTDVGSRHLAYVMYTSGTTGTPKGIQIEHRSIVNRIIWMNRAYPLAAGDRVLQKTPIVFDVSVWELFWAHWTGAAIVFAKPEGHRNLQYLAALISAQAVSVVHFTPTMLSGLIQAIELEAGTLPAPQDQLSSLRYLFCSGEVLHDTTVARAQALMPHVRIFNLYGPTEAAIDVLSAECIKDRPVCLGKPIANTRVYVLDDQQRLLPPGLPGQLYLAGDGLARGYLNQPSLNAQQFIANPLLSKPEQKAGRYDRLYKTGDLVRWLPSGELAYIGRLDRQIKLRGNRIELDEIEQVILRYPFVIQCAVIVDDKQLVACYTLAQVIDEADLQRHAQDWLPDYMLPHQWLCVEQLPTGITGKVDYKLLSRPAEPKSQTIAHAPKAIETTMAIAFAAVLGLELASIRPTDNFFKIGGDSILAIRLVARINELLNEHLQVRQVFELKTIQALSEFIAKTGPAAGPEEIPYQPFSLIDRSHYQDLLNQYDIEDIYPASQLQIGMLLESSLNDFGTYHDVFYYEINLPFGESAFKNIWEALANKHALLRARFFLSEEHALDVVILRKVQLDCRFYVDQNLVALIDAERLVTFAHTEECLFHLLVNEHADSFELIFSFHHAIVDGWSVASLINEFVQAYACGQTVAPVSGGQPPLSYGEFVRQERCRLDQPESLAFWKDYLDDAQPVQASWKFDDHSSSPDSLFTFTFHLASDEAKQAHQLARYYGVSVDVVFLYAYLKTLSFFMNSEDLTIGVVFNNRLEKMGGDTLFGLFLNVLPWRQKIQLNQNIQTALLATFANKIKLLAYRHIPYAQLKSMVGHDLYRFGYNFNHFHVLNQSQALIRRCGGFDRSSIPLMLEVTQTDTFKLELKSHDSYASQEYLHYFGRYLKLALQNILHGQNELTLDVQDYKKMILDWNGTDCHFPKKQTLHLLFEEQAERTPDAIALEFEETRFTYRELNQRANRLASYLSDQFQIQSDDVIALCLDRNQWMVIAILAVLKSGGAYVPIEPGYPEKRIKYIVEDTKTKVLLTNTRHQTYLRGCKQKTFVIGIDHSDLQRSIRKQSDANLTTSVTSQHLAYVIYTSGTTGTPNGVMIEHQSVVNLCWNMIPIHKLNPGRRVAVYSNYAFDAFVYELFPALAAGCHLFLLPDPMRHDLYALSEYYQQDSIQVSFIPSSLVNEFIHIYHGKTLALIYTGGEVLLLDAARKMDQLGFDIINEYGPTEAAVCTTFTKVNNFKDGGLNTKIIGRPIYNSRCYVIGRNGQLVPSGTVGELFIAGVGLARGYINKPELSASKFVTQVNQGRDQPLLACDEKFYRTGDMARWRLDGCLEFVERDDQQLKIYGYRIEPDEIVALLNRHPEVKQSVVVQGKWKHAGSEPEDCLVAYFVPRNSGGFDPESEVGKKVKTYLEARLPSYMVPQHYVPIDRIPLTKNKKVDRGGLPDLVFFNSKHYLAPGNPMQEALCKIYSKILGVPVDSIGITDDFFQHFGGTSIQAIKLTALINRSFGANLRLKSVINAKSIVRISELLEQNH